MELVEAWDSHTDSVVVGRISGVGHPSMEGKIAVVALAALELVQVQGVGSDYAYIGGGGDPVVGKPSFELVAVAPWVLLYRRE